MTILWWAGGSQFTTLRVAQHGSKGSNEKRALWNRGTRFFEGGENAKLLILLLLLF